MSNDTKETIQYIEDTGAYDTPVPFAQTQNEEPPRRIDDIDVGDRSDFILSWKMVARAVHANAVDKGFWPEEGRNDGETIALMHSELSEALEAIRHGDPKDHHLPEYSSLTVELADCVIRIMDFAIARNLPIEWAILDKQAFNESRPHKHGKSF